MSQRISRTLKLGGRHSLNRSQVRIKVDEGNSETPPTFSAALDFSKLELPSSAAVVVEAYVKHTVMRFNYGTVGDITHPNNTSLDKLDMDKSILFRVKVLDESDYKGKILASADGIRPIAPGTSSTKSPLLTVISRDLKNKTWQLDLQNDSEPQILINNAIHGGTQLLSSDPLFTGLVLPTVLQQVLSYIESAELPIDEHTHWSSCWLQMGTDLTKTEHPALGSDLYEEWVDDVIDAFCDKHQICEALTKAIERN